MILESAMLNVKSGRLISVPYTMETNDGPVLRTSADVSYFARICKAQFDRLYREGAAYKAITLCRSKSSSPNTCVIVSCTPTQR